MAQQNFIFSLEHRSIYRENYRPSAHVLIKDEIKEMLLKKGYLVKNLKEQKVILVTGMIARANIPLKERKKFQDSIDKEIQMLMQEAIVLSGDNCIALFSIPILNGKLTSLPA